MIESNVLNVLRLTNCASLGLVVVSNFEEFNRFTGVHYAVFEKKLSHFENLFLSILEYGIIKLKLNEELEVMRHLFGSRSPGRLMTLIVSMVITLLIGALIFGMKFGLMWIIDLISH